MTWALANIFKWFLLLPSSGHSPPPLRFIFLPISSGIVGPDKLARLKQPSGDQRCAPTSHFVSFQWSNLAFVFVVLILHVCDGAEAQHPTKLQQ